MKARLILPALLLTALLLSACDPLRQPQTASPSPEAVVTAAPSPEVTMPPVREIAPLDREASLAMAMVLNANRVLVKEDALFCYDFDENWLPVLARYRLEDGEPADYTVLAEGCIPEYLCESGGWLFYIDRSSGALERVSAEGGERHTLHLGPCRWLCLKEELLYFCDGRGRFLSLDPKTRVVTQLLSGPCAFAYPLEGGVLWREQGSGDICFTDGETGGVRILCADAPSNPLLLEDRIWYRSGDRVYSLDLEGEHARSYELPETDGAVELLPIDGDLYLRGIREKDGPVQWEGDPEGPFEYLPRGYRICDWLGEKLRVDTVYEPDGRILCYLLRDGEGRELRFLAGNVEPET